MSKLLLLDMDGTCRESAGGHQFIQHPMDQKIIPGADTALARYHAEGWFIFGASNQFHVAAGKKSLENCALEQICTLHLFPALEKIYFCPDYEGKQLGCAYRRFFEMLKPTGYSSFRKPGSGMIEYIVRTHTVDQCLFIGDREEDRQAASGAEIAFMWADAWREDS